MKPLLLIDVDGPLNPFDAPWFELGVPADGYEFHELTPAGDRTYRVALNPAHGRHLVALSSTFDLVWATTWQEDANSLIAPIIGLVSDLPVIPLQPPEIHAPRWCWKAEPIRDWVGQRSFVWFDDEINRSTRAWLDARVGLGRHLARRVAADVGLTDEDFDAFARFADGH